MGTNEGGETCIKSNIVCDQNSGPKNVRLINNPCTIECRHKVENSNHENTFNGAIEVSKEQDTSVIFLPSGEIETAQCYN